MDKQIVFYSKKYKIGYSTKNKCLYSPQIIKYDKGTEFIRKWIYYLVFVPLYPLIVSVMLVLALYSETDFERKFPVPICILLYLIFSIIFIRKKHELINDAPVYTNTIENKKMLRDVLISNDVNYKGIIILETIGFGICLFYSLTYSVLIFVPFLPIFIVAGFQKNIYYLFLIRKIAKQYGISLKSKDVLAENDAEAEKQINEEKEITTQVETEKDTEIENKTDTENKTDIVNETEIENKINLETNTQINTVNNKNNQNDKNADAKRKEDIKTESEINTNTHLTSTQNQNTPFDK